MLYLPERKMKIGVLHLFTFQTPLLQLHQILS